MIAVHDISDESLMVRIQTRDHQAFTHLVERHTQRFYAAAYRMVGSKEDAEDIVQAAYLKIWDRPEVWKEGKGAKFTTWFYRIITNMAIDAGRKKSKSTAVEHIEDWQDEREAQDTMMVEKQRQDALEAAIQALPDNQKAALNLCFYEGISNKDAAEILGVNVKALESLLMRAKNNVRDTLIREGIIQVKEAG